MSNASDFIIENGVLTKYVGPGGDVVIPEEVTEIGERVFENNKTVISVQTSSSLIKIGICAFWNCRALKRIVLCEGLVDIGEDAFGFCTSMEELILPNTVSVVNIDTVIQNCWNLSKIYIPAGAGLVDKQYEMLMGCLHNLSLEGCNKMTEIVAPAIPATRVSPQRNIAALTGFLCNPELYKIEWVIQSYREEIVSNRKKMLKIVLENDIAFGMELIANSGIITPKNVEKNYLGPALEAGATQCVAFLLNWKNENVVQNKKVQSESKDPSSVRSLNKIWCYETNEDGTIILRGYKGTEVNVRVPQRIGKCRVVAVGTGTFNGNSSSKKNNKTAEIESIEIPEGVSVIYSLAFGSCTKLNEIKIPDSVTSIDSGAFYRCPKVKIKAPVGSYAETYAKENNIPFVAE